LKTAKKILGKDVNSTKEQLIVHKEKVYSLLSNKSSTHYLNDKTVWGVYLKTTLDKNQSDVFVENKRCKPYSV
jgi:hypothetical protein